MPRRAMAYCNTRTEKDTRYAYCSCCQVSTLRAIQGQWKSNFANGTGTLAYADGDKYIGEWKEGKKCGQGELFYVNGDKFRSVVCVITAI